jgi:hypothetical protein
MLVVIWALGWAMILLAGLVFLPTAVVIAFGTTLILVHNLFDSVQAASADDAGACNALVVGFRCTHAGLAAAGGGVRKGAFVLLLAAPGADPSDRDSLLLRALRASTLDVRVTGAGAVSGYAPAGVGLRVGRDICNLGIL